MHGILSVDRDNNMYLPHHVGIRARVVRLVDSKGRVIDQLCHRSSRGGRQINPIRVRVHGNVDDWEDVAEAPRVVLVAVGRAHRHARVVGVRVDKVGRLAHRACRAVCVCVCVCVCERDI